MLTWAQTRKRPTSPSLGSGRGKSAEIDSGQFDAPTSYRPNWALLMSLSFWNIALALDAKLEPSQETMTVV
jgi:hypothetical protein